MRGTSRRSSERVHSSSLPDSVLPQPGPAAGRSTLLNLLDSTSPGLRLLFACAVAACVLVASWSFGLFSTVSWANTSRSFSSLGRAKLPPDLQIFDIDPVCPLAFQR